MIGGANTISGGASLARLTDLGGLTPLAGNLGGGAPNKFFRL